MNIIDKQQGSQTDLGYVPCLCCGLKELQNNKALKLLSFPSNKKRGLRELQNNKALKPQTSNARIKARIGIRLFCLCYDFTTKICGSKCFFVFFAVLIFTIWSILPPVMIYACMQQIKTHIVPTYFRQIRTVTQLLRRNFPSTRTSRR